MTLFKRQIFLVLGLLSIMMTAHSQDLFINEIMSDNTYGIEDAYGNYSDWIEIVNVSASSINLQDYYLSDVKEDPLKWRFPQVTIEAHGFILVFASKKENINDELHANFSLSKDGEFVFLSDYNGQLVDQLDSVPMYKDVSYGHQPDGQGELLYFPESTPNGSNTTDGYKGFLKKPGLNHQGGFYEAQVVIEASHADPEVVVRYTIDGSEPDELSSPIFESELVVTDVSVMQDVISVIETNPSLDFSFAGYTQEQANNSGWLPPIARSNKATVLKVKAFKENYYPSKTLSNTYFVNPQVFEMYDYPIISMTTDNKNLFDDDIGVYVYGSSGEEGNYSESGKDWEREVNFQIYKQEGVLEKNQNLGLRIHGGGRYAAQKSLRLYARSDYGKSIFKYKWFNNSDTKYFKQFLLKGFGALANRIPRDNFADLLIQNLYMDVQYHKPIIVFMNGEYWGIHTVKDRFNEDYLEIKYGKKDKDYVILENEGSLYAGDAGDEDTYHDLLDFVTESDMSLDESYDYIKTQIDMDNYLSYFTTEVFLGNTEWIDTNIKFWRYKGADKGSKGSPLDGRWRWFLYDFDAAFGHSSNDISYTDNVLKDSFDPDFSTSEATILAGGLKQNNQWRFDFVNKMCDLMNTSFNHKNFNAHLTAIEATMAPELTEHMQRWRYPSMVETIQERVDEVPSMERWNNTINGLAAFGTHRKGEVINQMREAFLLTDTVHLVLDVNDMRMGNVQINSILISETLDGIPNPLFPWHGTYFKDVSIPLIALPKLGYRFVEWQETGDTQDTISIQLSMGETYTAIFEEDPDFVFDEALFINEFMASNKTTIANEYDAFADWIELFNPLNAEVDLAGFFISDDAEEPYKYQLPRGDKKTIIPALGYMLIWADNRSERGPLHTNFKLSSGGEDIVFLAPDSSLIDNITYGVQKEDISFGRETDGDDAWKFFQSPINPTPGHTNNNAAIDDLSIATSINVYPNPVKSGEEVYFNARINIQVYNIQGQLIISQKHSNRLNTNQLHPGIYYIKTETKGVLKLLVQ